MPTNASAFSVKFGVFYANFSKIARTLAFSFKYEFGVRFTIAFRAMPSSYVPLPAQFGMLFANLADVLCGAHRFTFMACSSTSCTSRLEFTRSITSSSTVSLAMML